MIPQNSETPTPAEPTETRVPVILRTKVKQPWVTYAILAVTILIYGLQYLSQTTLKGDIPFLLGGKINDFILQGEVWRLITPMFLHGSLLHLAFNMYALFSIGTSLERHYGHLRFLMLYLIGGFTGNALSFVLSPYASLGASTAVFGLVMAEGVFIFKNKKLFGSRARSSLINLVLVILVNLSFGLRANSGIDNWGHLGGLAGGLIFAWIAGPIYQVQSNRLGGYELIDTNAKGKLWWGLLLSAGLFVAVVIGKFILR